ncbi:MAG TPA: exonuclease domain-containing protein, partial [Chloroflexota bacterium]|nr:exonuclease domain-containing protein [Chloroflexota bacterium]
GRAGQGPGGETNWLAGAGQGPGGGTDPLAGAPFAVVDVETTGGRTETHRILEVAVVCLDGGQVSQHYTSLVNPLCPVPAVVTELTGITQEMVEEAPTADAVLAEVRAATGDRVLVGHNLGADLSFLNYEALWHDLPPFDNPALDTEALAQRLLPDLRRPSLTRVAAALGLTPPLRHRALPDARLTAAVLLTLLRRLPLVDGEEIGTVRRLLDWLAGPLSERQARVRRVTGRGAGHLPPGTVRALPDSPGVYTFRDAAGEALYVGKAGSLRHRVTQHFSGTARALRRHDGLLERTAAVEHEVVGCELDALLLESARIRSLRPRYNVQARSQPGCPFLRFEAGPFPRAGATRSTADGSDVAGPYRTTQHVRHTLGTLRRVFQIRSCRRRLPATQARMRVPCLRLGQGLCPAPCAEAVSPEQYGVLVDFAWQFVREGREATLLALDTRLAQLEREGAQEGWEGVTLRECRARLRRLRREHRPVGGGLAGAPVVLCYPDAGGGAVLFLVREGRLLRREAAPREALTVASLGPILARVLASETPAPDAERTTAAGGEDLDADQARILLRWVYRRSGKPECVTVGEGETEVALALRVLEALRAGPSDV